jgi:hypothetical protein
MAAGSVAQECGVEDHHSSLVNINSSALQVACPPPGIGAKKNQETSETSFGATNVFGSVALECAVVDLHGAALLNINSTAL